MVKQLFKKSVVKNQSLKIEFLNILKKAVTDLAIEFPAYGQLRASNELRLKGILISPAGVRCVWLRNDLENFQKRLKALETKVNQEGIILTEEQIAALEKIKETKEAHARN